MATLTEHTTKSIIKNYSIAMDEQDDDEDNSVIEVHISMGLDGSGTEIYLP